MQLNDSLANCKYNYLTFMNMRNEHVIVEIIPSNFDQKY